MEACFRYSFVINNESVKSEQFQLMIVDITNSTEAKVGAETVVIVIVRKDSRMFGLFQMKVVLSKFFPLSFPL